MVILQSHLYHFLYTNVTFKSIDLFQIFVGESKYIFGKKEALFDLITPYIVYNRPFFGQVGPVAQRI